MLSEWKRFCQANSLSSCSQSYSSSQFVQHLNMSYSFLQNEILGIHVGIWKFSLSEVKWLKGEKKHVCFCICLLLTILFFPNLWAFDGLTATAGSNVITCKQFHKHGELLSVVCDASFSSWFCPTTPPFTFNNIFFQR